MTGEGGEGAGAGASHLLLALVIWPLTTHPFRDGAAFLLLIETQKLGPHYVVFIYDMKPVCIPYPLPVSPSVATIYLVG